MDKTVDDLLAVEDVMADNLFVVQQNTTKKRCPVILCTDILGRNPGYQSRR